MGSMVVNYYRKRDRQDEHVPKVCEKLFDAIYSAAILL